MEAVLAIYAKENGKGLVFANEDLEIDSSDSSEETPKNRPHLRVVK